MVRGLGVIRGVRVGTAVCDSTCSPQVMELLRCIPLLLFLLFVCGLDHFIFSVLSIIQNHSFVEYSYQTSHHLTVNVMGTSLMAQLLRSTIGALNTSFDSQVETSNLACLPQPTGMTRKQYENTCLPLGLLALLCLAQVYPFRLRRAIAAFYFPKREKTRVIFLYNKLLRQRKNFVQLQRGRIARQARQAPGLVSGDRDTGTPGRGVPLSCDPHGPVLAPEDIESSEEEEEPGYSG
uniref:Dendritic cell-specific transmembrane protein-like domain-containing protein n=1 Tax=Malurus cyaneus samueli TaxID=2593467 RepID=A0A8C5TNY4_9PASS